MMTTIIGTINIELWMLHIVHFVAGVVVFGVSVLVLVRLLGIRYIPHDKVGIVEKLWSFKGSLSDGKIVAFNGEAGFQTAVLRGGLHLWLFPWQHRIHKEPLVTVSEGKIGYVYARDGAPWRNIRISKSETISKFESSNSLAACLETLSTWWRKRPACGS